MTLKKKRSFSGIPKLTILTFHRLMSPNREYFIPPMAMNRERFSRLVDALSKLGPIRPLQEAVEELASGTLQGHNFSLTFDDGYIDNFYAGMQILIPKGMPATFFVPFNQVESGRAYWWDSLKDATGKKDFWRWFAALNISGLDTVRTLEKIDTSSPGMAARALVQLLNGTCNPIRLSFLREMEAAFGVYHGERMVMNWDEIQTLAAGGFEIGSHTLSHIPLTDLPLAEAETEIRTSRKKIGEKSRSRVKGFCYPRGASSNHLANLVKQAGYAYAVGTKFGSNFSGSDPYLLKRRSMSDFGDIRRFLSIPMYLLELSGWLDPVLLKRRIA